MEKFKNVDKGTIIRSVSLVLAIANQAVATIGQTTFASATWYQILSIVVTGITAVIAAWENNDWTYYARIGTGLLNALEDGKVSVEEAEKIFEDK